MKALFLRRNKNGLKSIRKIRKLMVDKGTDIRNDRSVNMRLRYPIVINWGYVRVSPQSDTVLNNPLNVNGVLLTSNKSKFRKLLHSSLISSIPTYIKKDDATERILQSADDWIIRPQSHFGGSGIHIVGGNLSSTDKINSINRVWKSGSYASPLIKKEREFRVFIGSGRIVFMVEKIVPDKSVVAWNVTQGGRFENVSFSNWDEKVCSVAVDAFKLTSLDFGAVDVIVDGNGTAMVLEINTSPHIEADYWAGCVAKYFDYIIENGSDIIPLPSSHDYKGTYRDFIHPAISDKARL